MRQTPRVLAVLLLAAIVAAAPGGQLLALPAMHTAPSTGCHESMPENPTPARANYQCCVSGHNWAVPSAAFSSAPFVDMHAAFQVVDPAIHVGDSTVDLFFSPSASPPQFVALRI